MAVESDLRPLNIRRTKKRTVKEESTKKAMVVMLGAASSAIFTSVAMLTKHDHWNLAEAEAEALSIALNDAINTLPVKYYEQITGIIEKWVPWINLTFVFGAIVTSRVEDSIKIYEKQRAPFQRPEAPSSPANQGSDRGHGRAADNPFNDVSTFEWDQR